MTAQRTPGSPTDPNGEPITANLVDLNPFWVGTRLLHIESLAEYLHLGFYYLESYLFWTIRANCGLV